MFSTKDVQESWIRQIVICAAQSSSAVQFRIQVPSSPPLRPSACPYVIYPPRYASRPRHVHHWRNRRDPCIYPQRSHAARLRLTYSSLTTWRRQTPRSALAATAAPSQSQFPDSLSTLTYANARSVDATAPLGAITIPTK